MIYLQTYLVTILLSIVIIGFNSFDRLPLKYKWVYFIPIINTILLLLSIIFGLGMKLDKYINDNKRS